MPLGSAASRLGWRRGTGGTVRVCPRGKAERLQPEQGGSRPAVSPCPVIIGEKLKSLGRLLNQVCRKPGEREEVSHTTNSPSVASV